MFGVKADYLDSALEQMGDLRKYAQDILGLSDQDITKLRDHYLE